ncbi:folate receptor gamma-like [Oscarella lobularis]|uniref:folate receptor gamma-like n=1 Tax=Oscarella lobularis TaxID=121494 RepID=UPI003313565F
MHRLFSLVFALAVAISFANVIVPKTCIPSGYYHKPEPSNETSANFTGACATWKSHSCCTTQTAQLIDARGDRDLYDFHWDDCDTISPACEYYLKAESCFYECSPDLGPYSAGGGKIRHVPICADYCDAWFEACRSIKLCAANWLEDFVQEKNGTRYHCVNRTQAACRTFEQTYTNGKGLCEIMWGQSFRYETSTSATCFRMDSATSASSSGCVVTATRAFTAVTAILQLFCLVIYCF